MLYRFFDGLIHAFLGALGFLPILIVAYLLMADGYNKTNTSHVTSQKLPPEPAPPADPVFGHSDADHTDKPDRR